MQNDIQSRKWQITINNPTDKGYTHEFLKEQFLIFKSLVYWCMSDEVGQEGTPHTHVYMAFSSAVRFSTIKKNFDGGHFEVANGTSEQNRNYVFKEDKWLNDKKGETNLRNTHEWFGEMPVERQGARNDITDLYDMIKDGASNYDIIESNPMYMMNIDKVERARQILKEEQFKNEFRKMSVQYVNGATGTGKTRTIMEKYGYSNVYRVTDSQHPWDGYKGQDVVVFEEFRSSFKIQDMLNYLDGYPLELPCRYVNKVACYTIVYIVTNIPLEAQYSTLQVESPATWQAFLRRIQGVTQYMETGAQIELSTKDYLKYGTGELPFQEKIESTLSKKWGD